KLTTRSPSSLMNALEPKFEDAAPLKNFALAVLVKNVTMERYSQDF
mgnify:CR=1